MISTVFGVLGSVFTESHRGNAQRQLLSQCLAYKSMYYPGILTKCISLYSILLFDPKMLLKVKKKLISNFKLYLLTLTNLDVTWVSALTSTLNQQHFLQEQRIVDSDDEFFSAQLPLLRRRFEPNRQHFESVFEWCQDVSGVQNSTHIFCPGLCLLCRNKAIYWCRFDELFCDTALEFGKFYITLRSNICR